MKAKSLFITWITCTVILGFSMQQLIAADTPKYTTEIPPSITTPDSEETRLGTLEFFDGMPSEKTAQLAYDGSFELNDIELMK